jgi:hypothetical protein
MKRMTKEENEKQAIENKRLAVITIQEELQKRMEDQMGVFHNTITELIGSSGLPIMNQIAVFRMVEQELLDVAFKKYQVK